MSDIKIGDFVRGISDVYTITNTKMTKGIVTYVADEFVKVKIIEHDDDRTGTFCVDPKQFEVIGHQKPFSRDEVLQLLKDGCKKAILDYNLRGADLRGADLRGADLSEADLSGANLSGAKLRGADLSRAKLSEADLSRANLSEADLSGANLRGADLSEADLSEADLSGADLSGANLSGAKLRGADLSRAKLSEANLSGADLSEANLDFSCLPLWCGGLHLKGDKRLACQLAYHLCSMQCDDAEYLKMRNSIIGFANQFHRADECGILTEEV